MPKDTWDTVSSELSSLGDSLRNAYRRVASEDGPTEKEIKDALATLAGAWDQVAASFSIALNDPETRAHLKKAAGSFAAALGATISDLGEEVDGRNRGSAVDGAEPED
ncbi:MAG: hypothetical protein ACRDWS_09660 [Acidimicrobiia bacterium]